MINPEQYKTQIINGIKSGMTLADMYILIGFNEEDIALVETDPYFVAEAASAPKILEHEILTNMLTAIETQNSKGRTSGSQWLLERLNPRWAGAGEVGQANSVHINFDSVDIDNDDTVTIFDPPPEATDE